MTRTLGRALAFVVLTVGTGVAADRQILGRKLSIRDPGTESGRVVVVQGKTRNDSLFAIVGDPTTTGATLQIVANGGSESSQTFALYSDGWRATAVGYTYTDPHGAYPVRKVMLGRSPGGTSFLKAVLKGNVGLPLDVIPPDPGDDGGAVLEMAVGDRYCVSFGGAAGGTETHDDAARWSIRNAVAAPGCPSTSTTSTTSTSTSTTSTIGTECGSTFPACAGSCPAGYHCEAAGAFCVCLTGGSDLCAVCDPPCTGSTPVCQAAVNTTPPYFGTCGCVTTGCNGICGGDCPAGAFCQPTAPGLFDCFCYFAP
jgi:hypothetical protein